MPNLKLPYSGTVSFIDAMASDFLSITDGGGIKAKRKYKIAYASTKSESSLRSTILSDCVKPIKKIAFDTRRVDQESDRNPRTNLQYWHRTDPFIDDDSQVKINTFNKLAVVLDGIKEEFGTRPDWHESYARVLYDAVNRVLRIKEADGDIDLSQLGYLEQLMDTRYRLTMDKISNLSFSKLKNAVLQKDEGLLKRGIIFDEKKKSTGSESMENKFMEMLMSQAVSQSNIVKNAPSREDSLAALFGSGGLRKDNEKVVERTVTITIRDEVKD